MSDRAEQAKALIERATEHVEKLSEGLTGFMVERTKRGEGDDPRVALIVHLAAALSASEAEVARLQQGIDEAHKVLRKHAIKGGYPVAVSEAKRILHGLSQPTTDTNGAHA